MKNIQKKINYNKKLYRLIVSTYSNGRICLELENNTSIYEITTDLPDVYCLDNLVFLNYNIVSNGILNILKKLKIVDKVVSTFHYDYAEIPIAKLNIGKIRKYDNNGVNQHLNKSQKEIFEDNENVGRFF